MTQDIKHTPTPWEVTDHNEHGDFYVGPADTYVAIVVATLSDPRVARSNAEFIVRACNSHASLLAALERCKNLAIERVGTADAAVKEDIYAADALMGIATTAQQAIQKAQEVKE